MLYVLYFYTSKLGLTYPIIILHDHISMSLASLPKAGMISLASSTKSLDLADVNAIEMDQPKTLVRDGTVFVARCAKQESLKISWLHLHAPNFREQKRMPRATSSGFREALLPTWPASACSQKRWKNRAGTALTLQDRAKQLAIARLYSFWRSPASTRSEQKFSASVAQAVSS